MAVSVVIYLIALLLLLKKLKYLFMMYFRERENIDNGPSHPLNKGSSFGKTTCSKFLFFFLTFRDGFKIYNSYTVKYAGFGEQTNL